MSAAVVLFFRDVDGYGWTERYFYNGALTISQIPADILQLVNLRAQFLTSSVSILHIRAASNVSRDPYIYSINQGAGIQGAEMPPTAPSEVAILVDFLGAATGYNRTFMRGIPERVVQADSFVPDVVFQQNFIPFLQYVANSGKFNIQGTLGSPTTQYFATNANPLPPRGFYVTISGGAPISAGVKVRFHGFSVPGYNGVKTCVGGFGGIATQFKFGGAAPAAMDPGIAAYATIVQRFDVVCVQYEVIRLSRRGAGRPFGVSRGRRSTLYSLRR